MTSVIQELVDEEPPAEEGEELKLPRELEASLVAHARAGLPGFLEAFAAAPDAEKWSYAVSVESPGADETIWMSVEAVGPDGMLQGKRRNGFLGAESEEEAHTSMTEAMSVHSGAVIDWSFISLSARLLAVR